MIAIQIIFSILLSISIAVKERKCDEKKIEKTVEAAFVEDEMDKLIELKSGRLGIGHYRRRLYSSARDARL